jgi:hypothetical protein
VNLPLLSFVFFVPASRSTKRPVQDCSVAGQESRSGRRPRRFTRFAEIPMIGAVVSGVPPGPPGPPGPRGYLDQSG